jgi:hypothetical protein
MHVDVDYMSTESGQIMLDKSCHEVWAFNTEDSAIMGNSKGCTSIIDSTSEIPRCPGQ